MYQVLLLAVFLAGAGVDPLTDSEVQRAVDTAVGQECEQVQQAVTRAERQIKKPDRSGNAKRNKVILRKQIKAGKKRIKDLRSGKVEPRPQLKLIRFSESDGLAVGQVGVIAEGKAKVVGQSANGAVLRTQTSGACVAGHVYMSGPGGRLTAHPRIRTQIHYSSRFVLYGVQGRKDKWVEVPQYLWLVKEKQGKVYVLVPVVKLTEKKKGKNR